ncbi:MAG TPA: hypothetical protein VGP82_02300 [Ktedonobacterales bacterium]|nr:hypothetical protein [Ktedonobacterales bacterium]
MLVQALDSDVLPQGGEDASTKDFTAALPRAVKNQALRDARAVWRRSFELGVIPVLRKPICQWNNQNWRIEGGSLAIPVCQHGQVGQIIIRCSAIEPLGKPGSLRIKRKRGKWIADMSYTLASPDPLPGERCMGVDLGVKVPAVVHVTGTGHRFFGNGRYQRAVRRRFYARRKQLQIAKRLRAVRTSAGKERRWMREINHQLSHALVSHAHAQRVGDHSPGTTRRHPSAHGPERCTHKRRGQAAQGPQKQPPDGYLDFPPTGHLHRLQSGAGWHQGGMDGPGPHQ